MKAKWILPLALAAGLMGGAAIAEAAMPPLEVTANASNFAMNADVWEPPTVDGDTVAFAAADLDGDGTMELLVKEWAGRALHTKTKVYTLGPKGPVEVPVRWDDGREARNLTIDFYFKPEILEVKDDDGSTWYLGTDVEANYTEKYAFRLKDGKIEQKILGWMEKKDGAREYYRGDGQPIEEKDYGALEAYYFGGMPGKVFTFTWLEYDVLNYRNNWKALDTYGKRQALYNNYEANETAMAW